MRRQWVATGYVVDRGRTLLLFYKKLGLWLPPGGHVEEAELPERCLLREIKEETGLEVEVISPDYSAANVPGKCTVMPSPSHIQLEEIDGHHQHSDLIYFCRVICGIHNPAGEAQRWFSAPELDSLPGLNADVRFFGKLAIATVGGQR